MSIPSDPRDEPEAWTVADVAKHYVVRPAAVLGWVAQGKLVPCRRRPGKRGAYLFNEKDVLALDAHGRDVKPADVAAIIDSVLRRRKESRRGA